MNTIQFNTQDEAGTRSQNEQYARGSTPSCSTQYAWPVVRLNNGKYACLVKDDDPSPDSVIVIDEADIAEYINL